ncbi:FAD/NAD(P)-binding protein [Methylorubrum suomiense]
MTRASLPPVAVIGAGFSGTMAALQLLSTLPPERPVLLCERGGSFGRGLAYGTGNPAHLLNLRATNMSAFPDRPRNFEEWLGRLGPEEAEGIWATPPERSRPAASSGATSPNCCPRPSPDRMLAAFSCCRTP